MEFHIFSIVVNSIDVLRYGFDSRNCCNSYLEPFLLSLEDSETDSVLPSNTL